MSGLRKYQKQTRTRKAEVRVASDVQDKVDGSRRRSRVGRKGGDLLYYYSHVSLHKSRIMTDLLSAFE